MRYINILFLFVFVATAAANNSDLLDRDFRRLASEETVNLKDDYEGNVVLVVNTASKCGNTHRSTKALRNCIANMATKALSYSVFLPMTFSARNQAPRKRSRSFAG